MTESDEEQEAQNQNTILPYILGHDMVVHGATYTDYIIHPLTESMKSAGW